MTKLSLVPRDDEAEALYCLDKTRRILSPDPVERDAALALLCKPHASIAVEPLWATIQPDPEWCPGVEMAYGRKETP